ncbi:hypothetical protein [Rheinheimera sp. MMS21-TC3]|uniref:hypothetical protein n=1 Tax=Rheinheimera sp. MMS21-TC3 TaxID=3072790 RepID=UPI0028C499CD|nr:hypothetical protein [Rheinheimera sp. MMS21-TC3]WNO60496.1 hypothetical protein RDV63_05880 [Rheinheimera sp. MMS21-TC3]
MKSTVTLKIALISAILIVIASLYFLLPKDKSCTSSNSDSTYLCSTVNSQSWFSWLKGQSRSTQFHFVDLLELINRASPSKKS